MSYTAVIGLEIHAELLTKKKIFCSCPNEFAGAENTRVCPICAGFPGALPHLNKESVIQAVKAGYILNSKINNTSVFDRKNYFYPDLPKAYQITQYYHPICEKGYLDIPNKRIGITRIHIEEDAGKLIHENNTSKIDYNRCGVPLIEIVTEPDFRTKEEVVEFVEAVALRLKYADICDARLEQGSLRVDVNISVMEENSKLFGTRAEIKNLNSYKSIQRAIEYEINRQSELLEKGDAVIQETRRFDENKNITVAMRLKEEACEYRYFPEPDIPPIFISNAEIKRITDNIPEMPEVRLNRYINEYSLSHGDAMLIVQDKNFSDYFEKATGLCNNPTLTSKLMLGEINHQLNISEKSITDIELTPEGLSEIVKMTQAGKISKNSAKEILRGVLFSNENPCKYAENNGYLLQNNDDLILKTVEKIIVENPSSITEYKNGNKKVFAFLMGQVLRNLPKGSNPLSVKEIIEKKLYDTINK